MTYKNRLVTYLRESRVDFRQIELKRDCYTGRETAKALDIRPAQFAKVVMVWVGRNLAMVVVPANCHIKLKRLKALLSIGTKVKVRLAKEREFATLFPGCEVGAMAPFSMGRVPIYIDKKLRKAPEVFFKAGTHRSIIRMSSADYFRLARPQVRDIAVVSVRPWWRRLLRKFFKKLWRWIIS